MGKGIGLISGHTKKVGNTVGFRNSASNNGQTQGYRVYQPIVKNPQTAAQAEQRAKTAAINATYSHLKMIIDRGNESLPYGNRSRCAWLKQAFKSTQMPWIVKGMPVTSPVGCQLTKGTLPSLDYSMNGVTFIISCNGVTSSTPVNTVAALSEALLAGYPTLKKGDQVTFVMAFDVTGNMKTNVYSIVLSDTDTSTIDGFNAGSRSISYEVDDDILAGAIIVSRLGTNGKHLRSSEFFNIPADTLESAPYDADSKSAAIASYQSSAATNTDWAEDNS